MDEMAIMRRAFGDIDLYGLDPVEGFIDKCDIDNLIDYYSPYKPRPTPTNRWKSRAWTGWITTSTLFPTKKST